jgi:hypothetical protein
LYVREPLRFALPGILHALHEGEKPTLAMPTRVLDATGLALDFFFQQEERLNEQKSSHHFQHPDRRLL